MDMKHVTLDDIERMVDDLEADVQQLSARGPHEPAVEELIRNTLKTIAAFRSYQEPSA